MKLRFSLKSLKSSFISGKRAWSMDNGTEKTASNWCGYRGDGKQAGADSMDDNSPGS